MDGGPMDCQPIPLITDAEGITAEWMRRVLASGEASAAMEIARVEVGRLSDVTNALGNLYRCRLIAPDGGPASPASVIVKLPTANSLALRFARWMSLHRREHVFYRDIAAQSHLRVPALFYCDFEPRSHRFVLMLEDLGGMEAYRKSSASTKSGRVAPSGKSPGCRVASGRPMMIPHCPLAAIFSTPGKDASCRRFIC